MTIQVEIKQSLRQDFLQILQSLKNVGMVETYEEVMVTYKDAFSETHFWEIIEKLEFKDENTVIGSTAQYLGGLGERAILQFYDILSEKLYQLDGEQYADAFDAGGKSFSADLFLYARCAIVAKGQSYYESILNNPALFPNNLYFESLLQLPDQAYKICTGKSLDYIPKFIYETGFNKAGWGEKAIVL